MIEGGRQEALLASQSPIPEADREDSEERPMEVIEATKAAVTSEAMATGDNGVVFGNGNGVVVDGVEMEEEILVAMLVALRRLQYHLQIEEKGNLFL